MMPRRAWALWTYTFVLLLGFPAVSVVYFVALLVSGVLPHDSDAIMIPITGNLLFAIGVSPFVLGTAWLCLRRYAPETRLLAWRPDRPVASLATLLLALASILPFLFYIVTDPETVWSEQMLHLYVVAILPWPLLMRGALLDRLDPAAARACRTSSR